MFCSKCYVLKSTISFSTSLFGQKSQSNECVTYLSAFWVDNTSSSFHPTTRICNSCRRHGRSQEGPEGLQLERVVHLWIKCTCDFHIWFLYMKSFGCSQRSSWRRSDKRAAQPFPSIHYIQPRFPIASEQNIWEHTKFWRRTRWKEVQKWKHQVRIIIDIIWSCLF